MLSGVIEGFYGRPWTQPERLELLAWMAAWGLDTYVYAPKDDLHHRALWREPYGASDADGLRQLIAACGARGIRFIYAISPGLDIRYASPAELDRLCGRFERCVFSLILSSPFPSGRRTSSSGTCRPCGKRRSGTTRFMPSSMRASSPRA